MKIGSSLPTKLAEELGLKVKLLLPEKKAFEKAEEYKDLYDRMVYFQQMAVTSPIEDCLIVYVGKELTEEQISVLRLIHQSTKPWLRGHVVGACLDKIENPRTANRDFAESIRVVLENIGVSVEVDETNPRGRQGQGITVKSTLRDKQNVESFEEAKAKKSKSA